MSADAIECEGVVVTEYRGGLFEVEARIGGARRKVLARRAGRMVLARIRLLPGDVVSLEVNPYDPSRGRITYRGGRAGAARLREA